MCFFKQLFTFPHSSIASQIPFLSTTPICITVLFILYILRHIIKHTHIHIHTVPHSLTHLIHGDIATARHYAPQLATPINFLNIHTRHTYIPTVTYFFLLRFFQILNSFTSTDLHDIILYRYCIPLLFLVSQYSCCHCFLKQLNRTKTSPYSTIRQWLSE